MKILLVEDEDRSVRQVLPRIDRAAPGAEVVIAMCRDDALLRIADSDFDLIVCDIRIPPTLESADVDERHGLLVSASVRQLAPGTPVIFLTAFTTGPDTRAQLSNGGTREAFGLGQYPMAWLCEKDNLADIESRIQTVHEALQKLQSDCIVVDSDIDDPMFMRAVYTYSKDLGHPDVSVKSAGGLSGAITGRVSLVSPTSGRASIFLKVADYGDALEEYDNFNRFVPNRLQPGYFAPFMPPMNAGLRRKGALVSTLADESCRSMFEVLRSDPGRAAAAVELLRNATTPWRTAGASSVISLGDLRRRHLSDNKAIEAGLDLAELRAVESIKVTVRETVAHGDLHGENIFVDSLDRPMMIDFGDIGVAPAPVDPVTLELSVLFSPSGPARGTEWGRTVTGAAWSSIDTFVVGSPFEEFLRECRAWAVETDSMASIYATVYAHALRQLKYEAAPRAFVLALCEAVVARLREIQQ